MVELLKSDIPSVVTVIMFIVFMILLYLKDKRMVFRVLKELMTVAEEKYGPGTGPIKHRYVVDRVYKVLPRIIKVLCSRKDIDRWIILIHTKARRYIEDKSK